MPPKATHPQDKIRPFIWVAFWLLLLTQRVIFISLVLSGFVVLIVLQWAKKPGFERIWPHPSRIIVALGIFWLLIFSGIVGLGPILMQQWQEGLTQAPEALEQAKSLWKSQKLQEKSGTFFYHVTVLTQAIPMEELVKSYLWPLSQALTQTLTELLVILLVVPFLSFWWLLERDAWKRFLLSGLAPWESTLERILNLFCDQLGSYLQARFIEAALIAFLTFLSLWLFQVPYALSVGVLAGLATVIPILGPLILLAYTGLSVFVLSLSIEKTLLAVGITLFWQLVDAFVLMPGLVGGSMKIHPLIILLAVTAGAQWAGFWGIILAIPVVVLLKILYQEWLQHPTASGTESPEKRHIQESDSQSKDGTH